MKPEVFLSPYTVFSEKKKGQDILPRSPVILRYKQMCLKSSDVTVISPWNP